MKLGIDIDDTISTTFETGMKYAEEYTKKYCNREYNISERIGKSRTHRHWQEIFEWNDKEEKDFFSKYYKNIIEEAELKENASEILNKLYENNDIILITARSKDKELNVEELTHKWLKEKDIPFNKIYMGKNKLEVCKENEVDVFVDDSYENCKIIQDENIKSYLMDSIMNRNIENDSVERVYGWNDLYKKL